MAAVLRTVHSPKVRFGRKDDARVGGHHCHGPLKYLGSETSVTLCVSCTQIKKKIFLMFYLFLRDRISLGGGAGREGDTESEGGSRPRAVSTEPTVGRCRMLNRLSHLGAPNLKSFLNK